MNLNFPFTKSARLLRRALRFENFGSDEAARHDKSSAEITHRTEEFTQADGAEQSGEERFSGEND